MAAADFTDPRHLSSSQQSLLRAALVSNRPQIGRTGNDMAADASLPAFLAPGQLNDFDFNDPALADYIDGDTSFDIDNTDFDADGNDDLHEKRKADDSDEFDDENDSKRQEGEDKQAKKPGRKPLTSEPTTKRKAQNRAAQRAFRERKEKHLKDLETKVSELTKTSETEKQQNGLLRAQVSRLQNELKDYRKRMAAEAGKTPAAVTGTQHPGVTYPNRSEFAFEFPVFGQLPTTHTAFLSDNATVKREGSGSPNALASFSRSGSIPQNNTAAPIRKESDTSARNGVHSFAGLFSPGILNSASSTGSPEYGFPTTSASPSAQGVKDDGTPNSGIARAFRFNSESAASNTHSPSQSSMSQFNATSSCNTSPAPSHPSPPKDPVPTTNPGLGSTDISSTNSLASPATLNGIDWLATQNGGQFDPVLFGDYRESQDAIVGDGEFNNGFFNEAFPYDFGSPLNFSTTKSPQPLTDINLQQANASAGTTQHNKPTNSGDDTNKSAACKELMAQIDARVNGSDSVGAKQHFAPAQSKLGPPGSMLSANTIWNQLQTNRDFQDGRFDLDGLCSELRAKAKCSESGIVVPDVDVKQAFEKISGQPNQPAVKNGSMNPNSEDFDPRHMLFDEALVDDAVLKLGGDKIDWGGFGLNF